MIFEMFSCMILKIDDWLGGNKVTNLLVRLFIKQSDQIGSQQVRTSYGVLASVVGIICNIILFGIKLFIGMMSNSISIMGDAFNNLSDAASSVISFVGVKLANRPADKEHPFGHGRFEYIAALAVAFLIFQVGFSLFQSSMEKIFNPEDIIFNPILIAILFLSILLKLWLMLFNRKLGNRINSTVLKAAAADSLGDVLVTLATVISTVIAGFTGIMLDGYMGVVVSIFVAVAGYRIAKETLEPLLGQAVDRGVYEDLIKRVEGYEGVVGTHDLIIHNYGPTNRMATIHVEIPNDMDIEAAHDIIDQIERDMKEELDLFLVIHMDPVEMKDAMILQNKEMVKEIVTSCDERATIHDLRIMASGLQTNFIFEVVVPFSYTEDQKQELTTKIMEEVRKKDSKYNCMITIETSFIAE